MVEILSIQHVSVHNHNKLLCKVKSFKKIIMSAEEAVKNETMDTETGENAAAQDDEDERKFFVGGLSQDAKDPEIRENFSKYER